MKRLLACLWAVVVGFALFAAGRAAYQNRGKLQRECERIREPGGVKDTLGDLSLGKVLNSVGWIKNIAR